MPPPSRPVIEGPDALGVVTLSGREAPDCTVFANNETTRLSYGQRTNIVTGEYRFPILASVGDNISMFYRLYDEDSMSLKFVIPSFRSYPRGLGGAGGATGAAGAAGATDAAGAAGSAGSS